MAAVELRHYPQVSAPLQAYVRESVLPRYDAYDKAHSRSHILSVISQSMELYGRLVEKEEHGPDGTPLNPDMIFAIAAYHDIGVCEGREFHHLVSGRMLEADTVLRQWFTQEQIRLMREAVEDHRSSNKSWPRSIYGRIVAEADKLIDFDTVFSRAILYARANYPELTDEEIFQKSYGHLLEKYGDGGYMRLQFSDSPNALRLAELREKLRDPELMRREFALFQVHPLEPFVPDGARVLLLGSFPPPHARWSMEFFYPNFQNDMWRIMGLLFYGDAGHFVMPGQKRFYYERVVEFCRREGIALYDAAYMVKRLRGNASDNFLKIIEPTDIPALLARMPSCRAVVSTGGKSAEQIASILDVPVPSVGGSVPFTISAPSTFSALSAASVPSTTSTSSDSTASSASGVSSRTVTFYRMPSSSRAYPLSMEKKAAAYARIFGL